MTIEFPTFLFIDEAIERISDKNDYLHEMLIDQKLENGDEIKWKE